MQTNQEEIILPERAGANVKSTGRIWELASYVRITTLVVPSTTVWALFPSKTIPSTRTPRQKPITPSRTPRFPPHPGKLSSAQVASSGPPPPQLSAITTLSTPPSFPQPRMAYSHKAVEFLCWRVRPPLETIAPGRGSGLINAGSGGGGNHFRPYQPWVGGGLFQSAARRNSFKSE